jgi:N-acetylglucosamine malate deacetylase 1
MSQVLVVAAHPDDAELSAGGTIALLTERGVEVTVAILTVSERTGPTRLARMAAAERAAKILGHSVHWMADGAHDQVEDIPVYRMVGWIDELVRQVRPETVLTHFDGDSHHDHVLASAAVTSSSRCWPEVSLLQFAPAEHRTIHYQAFVPNLFVPVAQQLPRKIRALAEYDYQERGFRALDSDWVTTQAQAVGACVGTKAAEAFRIVRHVLTVGHGSFTFTAARPSTTPSSQSQG